MNHKTIAMMFGVTLMAIALIVALMTLAHAQGFSPRYGRNYNIFNPINRYNLNTPFAPLR